MKAKLNFIDLRICEFIGKSRSKLSRHNGVKDAKVGDHDGTLADIQGFKAEYAFAKLHNLFPDFDPEPRSGSYDGVTRKGLRYDIKSTKYKTGNLLSTLKVNPDVDIYILAYVSYDEVEFIGWAKKEELIKDDNIKDLGHGKGYFLSRENLRSFNKNV